MIPNIRLTSQQLANPIFSKPKDLVIWMGALQAQDYTMVKWAIGMRLQNGTLEKVNKAIATGEIIRTHVMRPTWQFVPAGDLRWMLQLSAKRNKAAFTSYARQLEITESVTIKGSKMIEQMLSGNNHLTKQEIKTEFNNKGMPLDTQHISWLLGLGEMNGIICSGADKGKNPTYALLDERISNHKELTKEESLALLATRYFQSHSPATLEDFSWWSGLTMTETRQAIHLINDSLTKEEIEGIEFFIHDSCCRDKYYTEVLHFLPAYDEFLISYKSRNHVLKKEHQAKAFNNYGIFQPVILHNGQIVGNWKKITKKDKILFETSFFNRPANKKLVDTATRLCESFYSGK